MEIEIRRPDDWHLHLRDGAAMAAVLPFTAARFARAIVMPNLKPPVTTTRCRGAISCTHPGGAPWRCEFHAADDAVPDRSHAARGNRARAGQRIRARLQALSRRRHHQCRFRRDGHPQDRRGARAHGRARHAAAGARRGHRARGGRVRSRDALHRRGARADDFAPSETARGVRTHHHARRGGVREGRRARASPPRSRPSTCCTIAMPSSKAAFARTTTACPSSRPSPIAPRCSTPPPAAIRASSWAPTARRTRSTPRRTPAAARACSPRTPASSCTPKPSRRRAGSSALEGFASDFGADFYRLPRNTDRIRLVKREWRPPANYPFPAGGASERLVPMRAGETIAWQLVQ